ncbi:hypothetical protein J2Y45_003234 [Dyadobacter sp. BE34]|uniref:Uncharacterized protein n=1 Tax=Dyadobacter fermentans TaxID=94254 RepID=A0ABU1QYG6_9BACT|nr:MULTISPECIES: hypothetical protein [Dyadobacter]MDR6806042.1 hypothetical protein [Dyadobacter fermentans]MDR7043783.1 hypothetical protein [Dyadobacter sp. BE242]MDR7198094.1 hypothetical protein [Dyadobacter sp. BE34]MDR7216057.1 hypothetical protein [Dyadobacter sp. BE31]MDR7264417.1 hypothetical protein [Dyadobacter sp. BE32]
MTRKAEQKKNYQMLLDWYQYRAEENKGSHKKLLDLLAKLNKNLEADESYDKDIDDLESLKIIYETGIRRFESQVEKYQRLIDDLE